jgi:predicted nucleic acid-binding protein
MLLMPTRLVLLDNTVLTNFALVDRSDLVLDLWGADSVTTSAVMTEYQAGVTSRGLPTHIWDSLIQLTPNSVEKDFAEHLSSKLGSGERTCLAIAVHRQGMLVSDDAEARREAQRFGLPLTGSIGILVLNVRQGRLTQAEGNVLLEEMIALGYHSPIATLDDLL